MGKDNLERKRRIDLHLISVLQGLSFTLLLIIMISLVLALLAHFASWQCSTRLLSLFTHASVIGGAIWAGKRCGSKAWLHGLLVGMAAFLIFTWIGGNQTLFATWLWLKRLLRMGFVAMLGGILGGLIRE